MILYHGSNMVIDKVDLTKSKVGKDFGCGFYLSAMREQALQLAERKTEQLGYGTPVVSEFEFDAKGVALAGLKVLRFNEYSREWAEFILNNRQNRQRQQIHDYDIVFGPIANDTVGFQIRRFVSGIISMDQFVQELQYMKGISFQYFFGTERALKFLKRR